MPALDQQNQQAYHKLLHTIRQNFSRGAGQEVDAMLRILELERWPAYWKTVAPTFPEVLVAEKLCTPACWRAFKKAQGLFPDQAAFSVTAHLLGVKALCLIAKQPTGHARLIRLTEAYVARESTVPTYQYVTQLLGKKKAVAKKGPSRKTLLNTIESEKARAETWKASYLKLFDAVQRHNNLAKVRKVRIPE